MSYCCGDNTKLKWNCCGKWKPHELTDPNLGGGSNICPDPIQGIGSTAISATQIVSEQSGYFLLHSQTFRILENTLTVAAKADRAG